MTYEPITGSCIWNVCPLEYHNYHKYSIYTLNRFQWKFRTCDGCILWEETLLYARISTDIRIILRVFIVTSSLFICLSTTTDQANNMVNMLKTISSLEYLTIALVWWFDDDIHAFTQSNFIQFNSIQSNQIKLN